MTDINLAETSPHASPLYLRDEELKQGVDLLFSGFSAVFAEGDALLRAAGLGRAHRRSLYFIARNPGLTVAGLLAILKVTKQSLARVLNDLIAGGYIERKQAPNDRRMRQLHLTAKGAALDAALWKAQRPLLVRACRDAGPEAVAGFRRVLMGLAGHRSENHAP